MTDSTDSLRRQIASAAELQSVVRTMRALAASSITQYERAVQALADYHRSVNLGLGACLRQARQTAWRAPPPAPPTQVGLIVFGSDQGLVGPFNDVIAAHALEQARTVAGPVSAWAIGARVRERLQDAGVPVLGHYEVPNAVEGIAPLVARLQIDTETHPTQQASPCLFVVHNQPRPGALYEPVCQPLLPLDAAWREALGGQPWPGRALPEVFGAGASTLRALTREYLFISLFRACAESLSSENASRLAAMQRADKNIAELLERLHNAFHRLRQSAIDEELFDVVAGFEALTAQSPTAVR